MKTKNFDVLYGMATVDLNVPSTIEESDNLLGETGATLDEASDNIVYRNTLPRLYKAVGQRLVADGNAKAGAVDRSGNPVKRKLKGGEEKDVAESDIVFIGRVWEAGDADQQTKIAGYFTEEAEKLAFYEKGAGGGGSGKISASALESANKFIAEGDDKVEHVISQIEANVPGYKVTRDSEGNTSPEGLARAIQALERHLANEAKKAKKGILG